MAYRRHFGNHLTTRSRIFSWTANEEEEEKWNRRQTHLHGGGAIVFIIDNLRRVFVCGEHTGERRLKRRCRRHYHQRPLKAMDIHTHTPMLLGNVALCCQLIIFIANLWGCWFKITNCRHTTSNEGGRHHANAFRLEFWFLICINDEYLRLRPSIHTWCRRIVC